MLIGQIENFVVITGSKNVRLSIGERKALRTTIGFDIKKNGRGPTIEEVLEIASAYGDELGLETHEG